MDEVGVIIKKITEDGMLKFGFVGGVDPRVVIGRPVRFGDVPGVIGIKAVHLTTAAERRTMPKTKNLYIDIGATSRAAAEKLVSLGDYGVFDSAVVEFGDGLIKAKAIDDRVGCAALGSRLLEDEPPVDTWFCFTVQEETGLRGAASMAFALDPGFAMVLEGTTAADLAEVKGADAVWPRARRRCAAVHGRRDHLRRGAVRAAARRLHQARHPVADQDPRCRRYGCRTHSQEPCRCARMRRSGSGTLYPLAVLCGGKGRLRGSPRGRPCIS